MGARLIAVSIVLVLALTGPLQPLAAAQQAVQPPAESQQPAAEPAADTPAPAAHTRQEASQAPAAPQADSPAPAAQVPADTPVPAAHHAQQQPAEVVAVQAQPSTQPAPAQPPLVRQRSHDQGTDVYDVGAVAINVIALPLKATTCVVGGAVGLVLLAMTFGSAHKATAGVVREGCGQKWIVRGDDIRPARGAEQRLRDWDDYDGASR